jgi:sugar/nucleoside kinase (ribokinase family)
MRKHGRALDSRIISSMERQHAQGPFYIAIGAIIIDDIILPDGTSRMGELGGGTVHAAMGMRIWAERVGLVALVGSDFPADLRRKMSSIFDLRGLSERPVRTVRAWQLFEEDGRRTEILRVGWEEFHGLSPRPDELPEDYLSSDGVHLHVGPEEALHWLDALQAAGNPVIVWEPPDYYCTPELHALYRQVCPRLHVLSPNLLEGQKLSGETAPDAVVDVLLGFGVPSVALRMGAQGSLVANAERRERIQALPVEEIVDVTGAGNAYCGGLAVGLAETGDVFWAAQYASVSAARALRQFGAVYELDESSPDL